MHARTKQAVVIGGKSIGIPQGPVLGPLLLSLYVQPIGDIMRAHGLQQADGLQVKVHFYLNQPALMSAVEQTEDYLYEENARIMCANGVKTRFLPIVPKSTDAIIDKCVIRFIVVAIKVSLFGLIATLI